MIETWQKDVYAIWALCVLRHPSYRNGVSRTRLWELFKEGCHNAYGVRIPACTPLVAYQAKRWSQTIMWTSPITYTSGYTKSDL